MSEFGSFKVSLDNRKSCNASCKAWIVCPLVERGESSICRVQNMSDYEKARFYNIFVADEKGLKNESLSALYRYSVVADVEKDPKEIAKYLEMLLKIVKTFRDEKTVEEINEKLTVEIKGMTPRGEKTDRVVLSGAQMEEEDTETLFYSPKLLDIVKKRHNGRSGNKSVTKTT